MVNLNFINNNKGKKDISSAVLGSNITNKLSRQEPGADGFPDPGRNVRRLHRQDKEKPSKPDNERVDPPWP
jgi:hypothetical protein